MSGKILNITNGDVFNHYLFNRCGGMAVPFREVMMDGETVIDIYSDEYIKLRAAEHNISVEEYKADMTVYNALFNECYSELILWFGKDTFCQINLCTLLAYLEQIDYTGRITLNYIDDETFETLEENINIELGSYVESYKKILIEKELPDNTGVLLPDAVELYFDYLSDNGVLAELIYNNRDREESDIICIILENSKLYGLSDIQASKLIKKYKDRV